MLNLSSHLGMDTWKFPVVPNIVVLMDVLLSGFLAHTCSNCRYNPSIHQLFGITLLDTYLMQGRHDADSDVPRKHRADLGHRRATTQSTAGRQKLVIGMTFI